MTGMTIAEQEDKFELEKCTYMQRRSEALEKGIIVDESIFENMEEAHALMRKSKYVLMHNKPWSNIIGSNECADLVDPIKRYDLALDGSLGSMLGCEIHTDAFLPPHLKDKSPETMGKVIFVPRDTAVEELAAQIQTLLTDHKVTTEDERIQAGYAEAKRHAPDLTFEQYEAEVDVLRAQQCEYLIRLPEALAKGVFMDEATFDDDDNCKEVMELIAKSKYVLLKNRAWASIVGSNVYTSIFSPITRYALVLNGALGTALGCSFYTDAFLPSHLKDKSPETMGKVIFVPRDTE